MSNNLVYIDNSENKSAILEMSNQKQLNDGSLNKSDRDSIFSKENE